MPAQISSSRMHHGKRIRTVITAVDDSPEAFKAAQSVLDQHVREERKAAGARAAAGKSYRKKKTPKQG